jgi:hypothetical protein
VSFASRSIEIAGACEAAERSAGKNEIALQLSDGSSVPPGRRVEAIVEKFSDMQEDLDRERKIMMRLWAKREEQIHANRSPS